MKRHTKYIIAAVLVIMTSSGMAQETETRGYGRVREAETQEYGREREYGSRRYNSRRHAKRQRLVSWLPEEETSARYTVAIRPFHLMSYGLKLDFEFELYPAGQWLQFSLAGYYAPPTDVVYDAGALRYNGGLRRNFISGFNDFNKMAGVGAGAAYKRMFSDRGWYWSAGITFAYFNVSHEGFGYHEYTEDGMKFHEVGSKNVKTQFYKPGFNFNIGKHFALTRNLFLDGYLGLGYEYALNGGYKTDKYDFGMCSFGYSGVYISGGIRLGWMWHGAW